MLSLAFLLRFIIWIPLVSAVVDLIAAGYFVLVQYELNLVYGQVGVMDGDISRSSIWPLLLVGLAIANVLLSLWLWRKQKSAHPLRFRWVVALITIFLLAPLFIFGPLAAWQATTAIQSLQPVQ